MKKTIKDLTVLSIILLNLSFTLWSQNGSIRGTITDQNTGETLIGVNIVIDGTTKGTVTDFDGNFTLDNIEPGTYNLVFSYISYATKKVTDVELKPADVKVFNITMAPASVDLDEVVVTAKQINNTANAILSMQKRAETIQDGISALEMKRFATSNAAESMIKVTGVSVVDGKNVVIRGLGDRYANVQLDGQNLPSTNPYKNSADMDLIPSNLLDNIITSKTFTPDQSGNFTGGNVNMNLKSFPDKLTVNFSIGVTYNDISSLNDNFLTHDGGENDWLGYDDGQRDLPSILGPGILRDSILINRRYYIAARVYPYDEEGNIVQDRAYWYPTNEPLSSIITKAARSLNNQMTPTTMKSPLDQKISFSMGNQNKLFGRPIGYVFGANYKRSFSFYEEGLNRRTRLILGGDNGDEASILPGIDLTDTRGVESPQVSALASVSYKYTNTGSFELSTTYTHDADKESRYQYGTNNDYTSVDEMQTRTIMFTERELRIYKAKMEQTFPALNNTKLELKGSIIESTQEVPDLRLFANYYDPEKEQYITNDSELQKPFHFWRDLDDDTKQFRFDITIPFMQENSKSNKFKFGYNYSNKGRIYDEYLYQFLNDYAETEYYNSLTSLKGDVNAYFQDDNVGVVATDPDRLNNYYKYGHIIEFMSADNSNFNNDYTGFEKVTAMYAMVTYNVFPKLKFIGGARLEKTSMEATSELYYTLPDDTVNLRRGKIEESDILPSVNFVYTVIKNMNIRASYSKTLARPNMREMAPFTSFSFIGGPIEKGNPLLKRTLISNYDLRWEWFFRPGELVAISGYYKDFENPIIVKNIYQTDNNEITYDNVKEGKVLGMELELRKNLDFVPGLNDFSFSGNVSFISSEISIPDLEYEVISERNPDFTEPVRPFFGQSPFLANINLNYTKEIFEASLAYNKFGKRLEIVGIDGNPDTYEISEGMLDFISKIKLNHFTIGLDIKNILDSEFRRIVSLEGTDYDVTRYELGRRYSISLSYNL